VVGIGHGAPVSIREGAIIGVRAKEWACPIDSLKM